MSKSLRMICSGFALLVAGTIVFPTAIAAQSPSAGLPSQATAQPSLAETALLNAESKRLDAQVAHDVAALQQAIADEAIYIHANGEMQTKAEYIHAVETGASRYRSIEVADRTVQLLGDLGITHGMITLNVGVDRKIVARYTGVYAMRDGRWQVLTFQTTPIMQRQ
jgi:hypothetical protein